jgi:Protein of unknown function (DUF2568)
MVMALRRFNLALRSLMETGIVVALGYWGYHAGGNSSVKVLFGVGAPLLAFGFWGLVDFRQAGRMAEWLRLFQELIISGLAAVALYVSSQHLLGWTLGMVSVIHHVLVYLLGETLLKH